MRRTDEMRNLTRRKNEIGKSFEPVMYEVSETF